MRFSQVLARAARTEYRTPVMKHPYQPGSTFGFLVSTYFKISIIILFLRALPHQHTFSQADVFSQPLLNLLINHIKSWKELLLDLQLVKVNIISKYSKVIFSKKNWTWSRTRFGLNWSLWWKMVSIECHKKITSYGAYRICHRSSNGKIWFFFHFLKITCSVGSWLFRRLAPPHQTFLISKNCISNLFIHDDNSWLVQSKVFSNVTFQNVYFESAICMTEISSLPPTQNVSPFDLTDRNRIDLGP